MSTQQLPLSDHAVPGEKMLTAELPGEQQLVGHPHFLQRALSRRHFFKTAASATGIALGSSVFIPGLALADNNEDDYTTDYTTDHTTTPFEPRPIPGGIQPLGPDTPIFHTFIPGLNNEPSTITDFKGTFGIVLANGMGTRTDPKTGSNRDAFDLDLRFMQGLFVGMDGHQHKGTFAFVWLDIYEGQDLDPKTSKQIDDFNPGITPSGLFWTIPIPNDALSVDLNAGKARMHVRNVAVKHYPSILSSLQGGPSVEATASFTVQWQNRTQVRDATQKFSVSVVQTSATVAWSARTADGVHYQTDPASTSKSYFADLGQERNGVFFV